MKQKKKRNGQKNNQNKEFYEQLSDYPWQCWVLIKKGGLGSILSLPVEVKRVNVIYHVTMFNVYGIYTEKNELSIWASGVSNWLYLSFNYGITFCML